MFLFIVKSQHLVLGKTSHLTWRCSQKAYCGFKFPTTHTQRPVDESWDVRSLWKQLFCCSSRRALSSLWMIFLPCTCEHVFWIFSVPDLSFFSFSLSFFQKDLPLPRKNSRWVLSPFIPPSLLLSPSLCFLLALLGETGSLHDEKQSHREMLPTVILHIVFRKLWGGLSGARGVECAAFMWTGGRRLCRRDAVGVWLRPAGSSGCCPWCWKPFCLFQLLSHWLLISHSLFLVLGYNLWILCSHIHPSAVPIPLFWIPLPLSPARIPRIYLVFSLSVY